MKAERPRGPLDDASGLTSPADHVITGGRRERTPARPTLTPRRQLHVRDPKGVPDDRIGGGRSGRGAARLRPVAAEPALSGSRRPGRRPELRPLSAEPGQGRAARDGVSMVRRAGVVRRRTIPALERHSEQSDHALGRRDRSWPAYSASPRTSQWQHARPSGPALDVRARYATGVADGVRRHGHDRGRPARGQAAELAQRHRLQVRRVDLVHGPAVRDSWILRGLHRQARAADQRVSRRRQDRPADRGHRRRGPTERPGVLPGRVEALRRRGQPSRLA